MLRPVLVLAIIGLAGCVEPGPDGPWPVQHPPGWDDTPEMTVVSGGRYHSADQDLGAAGPEGVPRPAGCAAYQDGVRKGWDTCQVLDNVPRFGGGGPENATWWIQASWDGRGEDLIEQERDESRRTVVAFDAAGSPVAHLPRAIALSVE